jgi:hypothetical protein
MRYVFGTFFATTIGVALAALHIGSLPASTTWHDSFILGVIWYLGIIVLIAGSALVVMELALPKLPERASSWQRFRHSVWVWL